MCNDYAARYTADELATAFSETRIPLRFPAGVPNLEPRDDIRIGDTAPVVRRAADGVAELVQLRWSWPGPTGKPVFNFRSEGRRFPSGRALLPADAFYEFTPAAPDAPKRARKVRWTFRLSGEPLFCIAALVRSWSGGEAFSMLTAEPGADVAPIHARQVVVLGPKAWWRWLDGPDPESVLQPSPAGALTVERASS